MPLGDAPRIAEGYVSGGFPYGSSGANDWESVPDLQWPASVDTYGRMRYDTQIVATLNAYTYPLRAATWAVSPEGCRDEVVERVADAWGLPILGDSGDGPGPFRRRGVQWKEHLRMALKYLVYGFMPFAMSFDVGGTPLQARLTELSERLPNTITRIDADPKTGRLGEVWQYGEEKPIRGEHLLWYVHEREGSNWVGTSMLRPAYGPWLIKHDVMRVHATSIRRFGTGLPWVEAPAGATEAEVAEATRLAENWRVGDQAGVGLPPGFKAGLSGLSGSVPDAIAYLRWLDSQIAQAVLASVLNLDSSPNGSRALGETLIGLLEMSWVATADEITTPASQLNAKIVDWNFGTDEPVPPIVCTDINRADPTAEALQQLMAAGAVKYDPTLENAMRARYQFPPRDEDYQPPAPTPNPQAQPPDPGAAPTQPGGTTNGGPAPARTPAQANPGR
jgi:hypothetical protein